MHWQSCQDKAELSGQELLSKNVLRNYLSENLNQGDTVVQLQGPWFDFDLGCVEFHMFFKSVWVSSGLFGSLPLSKTMQADELESLNYTNYVRGDLDWCPIQGAAFTGENVFNWRKLTLPCSVIRSRHAYWRHCYTYVCTAVPAGMFRILVQSQHSYPMTSTPDTSTLSSALLMVFN